MHARTKSEMRTGLFAIKVADIGLLKLGLIPVCGTIAQENNIPCLQLLALHLRVLGHQSGQPLNRRFEAQRFLDKGLQC